MKSVRIEVTREDIALGYPGSCRRCPVAIAIGRTLALANEWLSDNVRLGFDFVNLRAGSDAAWLAMPTPTKVVCWIADFDATEDGRPFSFDLELPDDFPVPKEAVA
jgi:hypothetical protein